MAKAARDLAFELFSQGKRPKDPEIKALDIKSKTSYNYFQEWKKLQETPPEDSKGSKGSPKGSPAGSRKEPEKVVFEASFQITFWR